MAQDTRERRKYHEQPVRVHSWESQQPSIASWERPATYEASAEQLEHGAMLRELLIRDYAMGHLSAKAVCSLSWHAIKAGAQGPELSKLMLDPDNNTWTVPSLKTLQWNCTT